MVKKVSLKLYMYSLFMKEMANYDLAKAKKLIQTSTGK